jgi:hypothetical protein
MYDTMTRHYSHVFKGTLSPFHDDWDLETHSETFGNDEGLKERFEQLRKAEEHHCKQPSSDSLIPSLTGSY